MTHNHNHMIATLRKRFKFEAGHHIPNHQDGKGKCARPHGHSYHVDVFFVGMVNEQTGFVEDFGEISDAVNERIISKVDHRDLNLVYPNMLTTAENLAGTFLLELAHLDKRFVAIRVYETETSFAEVALHGVGGGPATLPVYQTESAKDMSTEN